MQTKKRKSVAISALMEKPKKPKSKQVSEISCEGTASASAKMSHDNREVVLAADYMPLDTTLSRGGASARSKKKGAKSGRANVAATDLSTSTKTNVIYVGRIPHGFYEDQMRGFFGQFGTIKRLRLSRNKKTGRSKHYAFIEFESSEVAPIVAEAMHNYLLFESMLQVKLVPLDKINPRMWVGAGRKFKTVGWQQLERQHHNRDRTPEEQQRLLESLVRKDQRRRVKLQDAGIDYDYPEIKNIIPPAPKKIKFSDEDATPDAS